MRWTCLLIVILLLATTRPTDVGQTTQGRNGSGHELMQDCSLYFKFLGQTGAGRADTFAENPFGMGYCAGVVRGVVNSASFFLSDTVCLPASVTAASAVWVIIRYLNDHPGFLYDTDTKLVLRALQEAYPCR